MNVDSFGDRWDVAGVRHGQSGDARSGALEDLLAAATAPGSEDELAGETAVMAAFSRAVHARTSAPPRRRSLRRRLAKLVASKVAVVALVASAAGGVAFAAAETFGSRVSDSPPATPTRHGDGSTSSPGGSDRSTSSPRAPATLPSSAVVDGAVRPTVRSSSHATPVPGPTTRTSTPAEPRPDVEPSSDPLAPLLPLPDPALPSPPDPTTPSVAPPGHNTGADTTLR